MNSLGTHYGPWQAGCRCLCCFSATSPGDQERRLLIGGRGSQEGEAPPRGAIKERWVEKAQEDLRPVQDLELTQMQRLEGRVQEHLWMGRGLCDGRVLLPGLPFCFV